MLGPYTFDSFGKFCFGVLDDVAFVENTVQPVNIVQIRNVVADDFVGCDDNVEGLQFQQESRPFSGIPGVQDWTKIVGIFQDLVVPMASESGRTDNERREMYRIR